MVGMTAQAQEFKRNIEARTFVPKGQWIVGSSVSYSEHNEQNYQFLVIDGFNSDGYTFKVSPMFCYAFKDNVHYIIIVCTVQFMPIIHLLCCPNLYS